MLAAEKIGESHTELCDTVKKAVYAYEFRVASTGTGPHANKAVLLTVHYALCSNKPAY